MSHELHALIDGVESARASLITTVATLTEAQATFRPAPEMWTVTENVEHLFLAEMSGVTKIWAARDQYMRGDRWHDALPNRGRAIEEIIAATWKPRETAPPIATPHIGGPLGVWISALRSLRSVLADTAVALDGLPLDDIVFPHFLSGPMNAAQRLEFLRFHLDRHHDQIRRIMGLDSFPRVDASVPTSAEHSE